MTIEKLLIERFGPLLTPRELAQVLSRSANGLRLSLRQPSPWAQRVNRTRIRLGRRVYFRTSEIASILSDPEEL